ncbi:hypothetical protein [Burkholderia pyrrocinia]|uniref:hypothetical protein n=1 Tax=Burkholderia pyrrocinia TaxID=60550 RepID=UPI0009E1C5F5|nr:hypothetical protein [Burkholderia pyrrocinia]
MNHKEMQLRNRRLLRLTLTGIIAGGISMLAGCGCWPFDESTRSEFKWKSQTLGAIFKDADKESDQCIDAVYADHLKKTVFSCRNSEYEKILNVITGEPVKIGLAKAICEEAKFELNNGIPHEAKNRIFNLHPGEDEISSCMSQKGFKGEEVEKKECYVNFMR